MPLSKHEPDDSGGVEGRFYSPGAQPLLQSLLATLADLDFAYERERDRISGSTEAPSVQARALRKLEVEHQERREPYIQHLSLLQEQMLPSFRREQEPLTPRAEGSRFGRMVERTSR